ncbi:LOW QUALITY PROTEIN: YceI family protein [Gillisia limnaea DSM 15749]|uniref:YceI family protein n=1 Tax=Gillisia limnaea (strain DSM 15749 / LMG 21470 / R-8282) TaxID=865937 RepID=H2BY26_GILLR|nr:LOW QUALITY PROTEIN: YceI family protein [Gillisia limnaea DSM 15749]
MANTKWVIDPTHSEVTFKVKHLMISTATGNFKVFQGSVETETEEFTKVKNLKFKADVKSVNTNNEDRDTHLKSEDFFNVEKFSEIEFTSEKFDVAAGTIEGKLTIKDTTNLLVLMLDFGGVVVDPYGQTKAGLTANGKISRKEFGLVWSAVTEAGSVVVGDQIKLGAEVQFIKQA